MIPSSEGNTPGGKAFPSFVAYTTDWSILVGEPARRQYITNPGGTVEKVKRKMGSGEKVTFTPVKQSESRTHEPEVVSAEILKKVKRDAEAYLGDIVDSAVITVPAYFNDNQRNATRVAGELAGFNILGLLSEPTAAAISYGLEEGDTDHKVLVFDMGGGTLDVTVMEFFDNHFNAISTSGDTTLGGTDMDVVITAFLIDEFKRNTGVDLSANERSKTSVKEASERAKIELSMLEETQINLANISMKDGEPLDLVRTLKRSELENIVNNIVQRCNAPIEDALSSINLTPADIDRVILVGGPTRMPVIRDFVIKKLGNKIAGDGTDSGIRIDPMECVCFGAAILAEKLINGGITPPDVTPLPLGLKVYSNGREDVFSILIEKNSCIPTYGEGIYTTYRDNQTSVVLSVYQGKGNYVTDPDFVGLGELTLSGILPAPQGIPQIQVRFDINSDGLMSVTAIDLSSGKKVQTEIKTNKWTDSKKLVPMGALK